MCFFHLIKVVIAQGLHLYPFRTEKLNLAAPMVLRKRESRSPLPSNRRLGLAKSKPFFLFEEHKVIISFCYKPLIVDKN